MIEMVDFNSGMVLVVPPAQLSAAKEWALEAYPNECGGILTGEYLEDGTTALVHEIVLIPDTNATNSRYQRSGEYSDRVLKRVRQNSDGRIHYLGEWHTHPDSPPRPSLVDISSIYKLVKSGSLPVEAPVLVILSIADETSCWAAYLADNKSMTSFSYPKL